VLLGNVRVGQDLGEMALLVVVMVAVVAGMLAEVGAVALGDDIGVVGLLVPMVLAVVVAWFVETVG
jgi:hypothetical protein